MRKLQLIGISMRLRMKLKNVFLFLIIGDIHLSALTQTAGISSSKLFVDYCDDIASGKLFTPITDSKTKIFVIGLSASFVDTSVADSVIMKVGSSFGGSELFMETVAFDTASSLKAGFKYERWGADFYISSEAYSRTQLDFPKLYLELKVKAVNGSLSTGIPHG